MKDKKQIFTIIVCLIIVIAITAGLGISLINANKKIEAEQSNYSNSKKQAESYKNLVDEQESQINAFNEQNKNNNDTIKDYKKNISNKNKEIKKLKAKVEKLNKQLGEKKEQENKVATVGEYTDNKGSEGIHLKVTSANTSSISFEYQSISSGAFHITGFNSANVSLTSGKGSFTYDNIDEQGEGTIEVINSKTIRFTVNCTSDETTSGYTSACGPVLLYLK